MQFLQVSPEPMLSQEPRENLSSRPPPPPPPRLACPVWSCPEHSRVYLIQIKAELERKLFCFTVFCVSETNSVPWKRFFLGLIGADIFICVCICRCVYIRPHREGCIYSLQAAGNVSLYSRPSPRPLQPSPRAPRPCAGPDLSGVRRGRRTSSAAFLLVYKLFGK